MRKTRRIRKAAALFAAGGMMLQFGGGCSFLRVAARNIPVGFGQTVGAGLLIAVPVAAAAGSIQPLIDQFLGTAATTTP